jgi:branched-chain amino acid transport system ATP-binding protein
MTADTAALTLTDVVSGYGKMTILNGTTCAIQRAAKTIFGLLPVREGKIMLEGRDITNHRPRQLLDAGVSFVPQGRNIFPELSVRHNLELGATALDDQSSVPRRLDAMMDRFPMLREKAKAQAGTLSGGQQKLLEVARGLLLDPKVMLIDEPSISLSPLMVQEVFSILKGLRDSGVTILLIEQNARQALQISDYGLVLEQGQTRIEDTAAHVLADPRVGELFLGGAMRPAAPPQSSGNPT